MMSLMGAREGYYKLSIWMLELTERGAANAPRDEHEMLVFVVVLKVEFWVRCPLSVLPFPVSFRSPWKPQINAAYVDPGFYCYREAEQWKLLLKDLWKSFSTLTRIQI